jgi:hypothetical protein
MKPTTPASQSGRLLDVLNDKGQRLSAADTMNLLVSARSVGGVSETGNPYTISYRDDGTFEGSSQISGQNFPFTGSWNRNDKGQVCTIVQPPAKPFSEACGDMYELDGQYYMAAPSGRVLPRVILK